MNLIVCDQDCRHQIEGYCTLNQIAQLTSDNSSKCGYFLGCNSPEPKLPEDAVQGL